MTRFKSLERCKCSHERHIHRRYNPKSCKVSGCLCTEFKAEKRKIVVVLIMDYNNEMADILRNAKKGKRKVHLPFGFPNHVKCNTDHLYMTSYKIVKPRKSGGK